MAKNKPTMAQAFKSASKSTAKPKERGVSPKPEKKANQVGVSGVITDVSEFVNRNKGDIAGAAAVAATVSVYGRMVKKAVTAAKMAEGLYNLTSRELKQIAKANKPLTPRQVAKLPKNPTPEQIKKLDANELKKLDVNLKVDALKLLRKETDKARNEWLKAVRNAEKSKRRKG